MNSATDGARMWPAAVVQQSSDAPSGAVGHAVMRHQEGADRLHAPAQSYRTPRAAESVTRETFMQAAERIADEIIAARKPRAGMRKRRRAQMAVLVSSRRIETGSQNRLGFGRCAKPENSGHYCWRPNCPRCMPA